MYVYRTSSLLTPASNRCQVITSSITVDLAKNMKLQSDSADSIDKELCHTVLMSVIYSSTTHGLEHVHAFRLDR